MSEKVDHFSDFKRETLSNLHIVKKPHNNSPHISTSFQTTVHIIPHDRNTSKNFELTENCLNKFTNNLARKHDLLTKKTTNFCQSVLVFSVQSGHSVNKGRQHEYRKTTWRLHPCLFTNCNHSRNSVFCVY